MPNNVKTEILQSQSEIEEVLSEIEKSVSIIKNGRDKMKVWLSQNQNQGLHDIEVGLTRIESGLKSLTTNL